jgi:hypothetical protein
LLVTGPDAHSELGLAFRRCAHWRELAENAEDESERLLLNWMAAECLAKLEVNDAVPPRLLAAVGLPSGGLWKKLSPSEASGVASLPAERPWRKRLGASFDRLRAARNRIAHAGYRRVDLVTLLTSEERTFADKVLPITTKCLSDMALVALNLRLVTLRDMWSAYPTVVAPDGVLLRASWFLQRLAST